jgi:hypothetical protein
MLLKAFSMDSALNEIEIVCARAQVPGEKKEQKRKENFIPLLTTLLLIT